MPNYQLTDLQRILNDSGISIYRKDSEITIKLLLKLRLDEEVWVATMELDGISLHITEESGTHHGQMISIPIFKGEFIGIRSTLSTPELGKYEIRCMVCGNVDSLPTKYKKALLEGKTIRKYLKRKNTPGFKTPN